MTKALAIALAVTGAVWFVAQAPANASSRLDGITNAQATTDMSARRRHRYRRAVMIRRYDAPRYYGYYGPTYYERPYVRPSPLWFGMGGWW